MRLGIRNMVNVEKAAAAAQSKGKGRESVVEAVLLREMQSAKASKADELVWLDGAAAGSLLGAVVGLLSDCGRGLVRSSFSPNPSPFLGRQISYTPVRENASLRSDTRYCRGWSTDSSGED